MTKLKLGFDCSTVASAGENTTWMNRISVPYLVYEAGYNADPHKPSMGYCFPNFGKEAAGYLTFIVEHYDCLPEVALSSSSSSTGSVQHCSAMSRACKCVVKSLDLYTGDQPLRSNAIATWEMLHKSSMETKVRSLAANSGHSYSLNSLDGVSTRSDRPGMVSTQGIDTPLFLLVRCEDEQTHWRLFRLCYLLMLMKNPHGIAMPITLSAQRWTTLAGK